MPRQPIALSGELGQKYNTFFFLFLFFLFFSGLPGKGNDTEDMRVIVLLFLSMFLSVYTCQGVPVLSGLIPF